MSHLTYNKRPDTALWLGLLAALLLAVLLIITNAIRHDGVVELQPAPAQTLLFFDITNNKL